MPLVVFSIPNSASGATMDFFEVVTLENNISIIKFNFGHIFFVHKITKEVINMEENIFDGFEMFPGESIP